MKRIFLYNYFIGYKKALVFIETVVAVVARITIILAKKYNFQIVTRIIFLSISQLCIFIVLAIK